MFDNNTRSVYDWDNTSNMPWTTWQNDYDASGTLIHQTINYDDRSTIALSIGAVEAGAGLALLISYMSSLAPPSADVAPPLQLESASRDSVTSLTSASTCPV